MLRRWTWLCMLLGVLGMVGIALGLFGAINVSLARSMLPSASLGWILLDMLWWPGYIHGFGFGGVLTYCGIGILLLGLSSGRARVAYWCLQIAIWCVGINTWYQQLGSYQPPLFGVIMLPTNLTWGVITLVCALGLLLGIVPVTRGLRWLVAAVPERVHMASTEGQ